MVARHEVKATEEGGVTSSLESGQDLSSSFSRSKKGEGRSNNGGSTALLLERGVFRSVCV